MAIYDNNSLILKLKFLTELIQNLNRVNQNHSYIIISDVILPLYKYLPLTATAIFVTLI
jgi:hypothetical protein